MATDSLFLDADVALEIILSRANESAAREYIVKGGGDLYISALTGHLVVYFGLSILREFLDDYTMLALEPADFEWAFIDLP